jgi:hypothetical protein
MAKVLAFWQRYLLGAPCPMTLAEEARFITL